MNKMKRYSLSWGILVVLLWYACSDKEDRLEPSHQDRNWMEIQDEPGELNQWRFRLYKEYGISTFMNDTIGSEQRGYDAYGQPITYYEMLWPGYTITGNAGFAYTLSSDTVGMIQALKMIYEWVAPNLFKAIKYRPASYLLCDEMHSFSYSFYGDTTYQSFDIKPALKTTTLSIAKIKDMDQEELKDFAASIVKTLSYGDILSYFEEELNDFYEISKEGLEQNPYRVSTTYSNTFVLPDGWKEEKLYSTGGFLHEQVRFYTYNNPKKEIEVKTPEQREDVGDYVGAVIMYSESEFEQLYGKYDKMMRKFRFMQGIMTRFKSEVLKE